MRLFAVYLVFAMAAAVLLSDSARISRPNTGFHEVTAPQQKPLRKVEVILSDGSRIAGELHESPETQQLWVKSKGVATTVWRAVDRNQIVPVMSREQSASHSASKASSRADNNSQNARPHNRTTTDAEAAHALLFLDSNEPSDPK